MKLWKQTLHKYMDKVWNFTGNFLAFLTFQQKKTQLQNCIIRYVSSLDELNNKYALSCRISSVYQIQLSCHLLHTRYHVWGGQFFPLILSLNQTPDFSLKGKAGALMFLLPDLCNGLYWWHLINYVFGDWEISLNEAMQWFDGPIKVKF